MHNPAHNYQRMGRPKLLNPRDARVVVRAKRDEIRIWKAAADAEGKSLSAWFRDLANKATKRGRAK